MRGSRGRGRRNPPNCSDRCYSRPAIAERADELASAGTGPVSLQPRARRHRCGIISQVSAPDRTDGNARLAPSAEPSMFKCLPSVAPHPRDLRLRNHVETSVLICILSKSHSRPVTCRVTSCRSDPRPKGTRRDLRIAPQRAKEFRDNRDSIRLVKPPAVTPSGAAAIRIPSGSRQSPFGRRPAHAGHPGCVFPMLQSPDRCASSRARAPLGSAA